ncbi:glycosyltransferase family 2 protein [Negadavirga shengliensis]|uniref:Glycosyltransferase family 2 protein n=1 Tax=Negadavirga shengliensis TaxID=1389218 RepID=A0ABV9T0D0_9BACT
MQAIVVTPVKDALKATLQTIRAIYQSDTDFSYIVFNDNSTTETRIALEAESKRLGYELIHLEDITETPSPNYKTVLQIAQQRAVAQKLPLVIIESDVTIQTDTLRRLLEFNGGQVNPGLVGAITHDERGEINFPYLKFKDQQGAAIKTNRSLSFCCTLLSLGFLEKYDFRGLDVSKDWYDTHISHKATELGFDNFILMEVPVIHQPHASRPWKMLKYKNPLLYYFKKWFLGKDKI